MIQGMDIFCTLSNVEDFNSSTSPSSRNMSALRGNLMYKQLKLRCPGLPRAHYFEVFEQLGINLCRIIPGMANKIHLLWRPGLDLNLRLKTSNAKVDLAKYIHNQVAPLLSRIVQTSSVIMTREVLRRKWTENR